MKDSQSYGIEVNKENERRFFKLELELRWIQQQQQRQKIIHILQLSRVIIVIAMNILENLW